MAFSEKITLIVDVVSGQSTSALAKIRTDVLDADGAFNKMKAGAAGAFDLIKQNAAAAALGAGTALVAFGAQAVGAFQDTALGAGQLRDSLGVTAEEASRLQEVAGDLGVGVGALESTMGRMNRTAATTPGAFESIGAAIAKNRDGTINVTQTFLNTVEALNRIPDASARAAAAQQIFGRSWMDISEMVELGAEGMQAAIDGVEIGKIMSDEDIAKARRFRDSIDQLKGVAEELAVQVGEALVPALTEVSDTLSEITGPARSAYEWFNKITDLPVVSIITGWAAPWKQIERVINFGQGAVESFGQAWDSLRGNGGVQGIIDEITASAVDMAPAVERALGSGPQDAASAFEARLADVAATAEDSAAALAAQAAVTADMYESATEGKARLEAMADAQKQAEDAAKRHADALRDQADQLLEQADAMRASVDVGFALRDAQRDAGEAAVAVNETIDNQESSLQDVAAALDQATQAATRVADAEVRQAQETARANGETLSASDASAVYNRSLLNQAATAKGPLRDSIIQYIGAVNGIPPEKLTDIIALLDQGKVAEAEAEINNASRKREAEIRAEATNVAATDRELDALARQRQAEIRVYYTTTGQALSGPRQFGGPVSAGRAYTVGEAGRELFVPNEDGEIIPHGETQALMSGAGGGGGGRRGGGNTYNISIMAPLGVQAAQWGDRIIEYIKAWEQRNGSGWRN